MEEKTRFCFLKRSMLLMSLCIALTPLAGCSYHQNEALHAEANRVIAEWLAYKKQVESTQVFAKEEHEQSQTSVSQETSEVPQAELNASGVETQQTKPNASQAAAQQTQATETGPSGRQIAKHGFYYSYLSDSMRVVYDEVYTGLIERREVTLSTLNEEHADIAFQSVLADHPEIFYVSGYHLTKKTMDNSIVGISLSGQYDMTREEITTYQSQIDAYASMCLNAMPQGLDEYGKVKYVFDYLVTHTVYRLDSPHNQNICSVFVNGESVCQGYAEATQYLLLKLGIETTIVPGVVTDGSRHVWNLVKVNGAYYYMDTTWGDVDYRDSTGTVKLEEGIEPINYDYFLVTAEQLSKTHTLDAIITMPVCVSTQDNYYVREGLYFEGIDEGRLATIFETAYVAGKQTVTIKCSSQEVYLQMKEYLVNEQNVFRFVKADEMISYSEDEGMCTLCFWL